MNVCLLLDRATLPAWQADALAYLLDHEDVSVTVVLYSERERGRTWLETAERALELREWAVVSTLNALWRSEEWTEPVPVDAVVDRDGVTERRVDPEIVDGWKQRIPAAVVDDVAAEADVAVRFGFGFLVGPVLSELEHGVLSYHHGDLRAYRGQPHGFWEFVSGEETAGITVQQLTEDLDAGQIAALKTVPVDDCHTWEAVQRRLHAESEDVLATAMRAVRTGRLRPPEELGDLYTLPRGRPVAEFAVKTLRGRLHDAL